ncbi:MAG: hypothetical protein ACE366_02160 [Bradymonadia bacterium]
MVEITLSHDQLRRFVTRRSEPEARQFWRVLFDHTVRTAEAIGRARFSSSLRPDDWEDAASEVFCQLLSAREGAQPGILNYRGDTLEGLMRFIRVITFRSLLHRAKRQARQPMSNTEPERLIRAQDRGFDERAVLEAVERNRHRRQAQAQLEQLDEGALPEVDMPPKDIEFLQALLAMGSGAEMARHRGVNRSTVHRRIQRIRRQVDALTEGDRVLLNQWLTTSSL